MNFFQERLCAHAQLIQERLESLLQAPLEKDEVYRPERLLSALRYSLLSGGKRIRPFLVLESAALFHADMQSASYVAAALECVHCYSLIHDDLPAMDDDDLRRGKPTLHIAYDEATAILAGDALLTLAFDILSHDKVDIDPQTKVLLIQKLARASGMGGMVGGQILDIEAEKKHGPEGLAAKEEYILRLQSMKTGALLRFACEAGAILGKAQPQEQKRLAEFGAVLGVAFQLADDILDETAQTPVLGKKTQKDRDKNKATLVTLYGVNEAKKQLNGLIQEAHRLLAPYGAEADILRQAARFVADRSY